MSKWRETWRTAPIRKECLRIVLADNPDDEQLAGWLAGSLVKTLWWFAQKAPKSRLSKSQNMCRRGRNLVHQASDDANTLAELTNKYRVNVE
jgi:hypothetical protein